MKAHGCWHVFVILGALPGLLAASEDPAAVVTERHERSIRGTIDGFPFLLLRGDHAELLAWPSERVLRVAVGKPGVPATESEYATVTWDSIFSLK
jgi:hypothetical protein